MQTTTRTEYIGFKVIRKECGCEDYYRPSKVGKGYDTRPTLTNSCHAHNNNKEYLLSEDFDYPAE